jgi:hypothetical protein
VTLPVPAYVPVGEGEGVGVSEPEGVAAAQLEGMEPGEGVTEGVPVCVPVAVWLGLAVCVGVSEGVAVHEGVMEAGSWHRCTLSTSSSLDSLLSPTLTMEKVIVCTPAVGSVALTGSHGDDR